MQFRQLLIRVMLWSLGLTAAAGAAAALMFLAGYPIAALGPLVAGGLRDLTGEFEASLWTLVGLSALTAVVLVPLTPDRLRPR